MMIPAMKRSGYSLGFASGLTAVASTCPAILPPSLAFVIYGAATKVSIGSLFLAGIIPGLVMEVFIIILVFYYAAKRQYPKLERKSAKERVQAVIGVLPSLCIPVGIVGGISGGFFTPTEAAAFAVVFALFLSVVVYRSITPKGLWKALVDSAVDSGAIMIIVGACYLFSWALANENVVTNIAEYLIALQAPFWFKLILINIGLLILGMFMDSAPGIMLVAPILHPALVLMGMDPIQAGVMICANLVIGLCTPPVGVCLNVASNIAKVKFDETVKHAIPFVLATIVGLLLITYIPILSKVLFVVFNITP
jgi:tripartite ATP-independent transporter DctM subunit